MTCLFGYAHQIFRSSLVSRLKFRSNRFSNVWMSAFFHHMGAYGDHFLQRSGVKIWRKRYLSNHLGLECSMTSLVGYLGFFQVGCFFVKGWICRFLSTDFVKFMERKRIKKIPWKTVNAWKKCRNVDENDLHLMKLQKPQPSAKNSQLSTTYPLTLENRPRFGRSCFLYIIRLVPKPQPPNFSKTRKKKTPRFNEKKKLTKTSRTTEQLQGWKRLSRDRWLVKTKVFRFDISSDHHFSPKMLESSPENGQVLPEDHPSLFQWLS